LCSPPLRAHRTAHVPRRARLSPTQEIAVVEAMKMQNILRAPCDAVIAEILKSPGETLSVDDIILEFAVPEAAAASA
jgi:acetyl/propionyl-CoA carboxylase alpha subunit